METTPINPELTFRPSINIKTTLMKVDDQRCFHANSKLMFYLEISNSISMTQYRDNNCDRNWNWKVTKVVLKMLYGRLKVLSLYDVFTTLIYVVANSFQTLPRSFTDQSWDIVEPSRRRLNVSWKVSCGKIYNSWSTMTAWYNLPVTFMKDHTLLIDFDHT